METAKKEAESAAYRSYVADTLFFMANGQAPNMRWHEYYDPKPAKEETRSADEIKTSMKDKLSRLAVT